ncbi:MAG: NAD(P)/FAD-dependent oxidoreductase [Stenotrophomonas sp.]
MAVIDSDVLVIGAGAAGLFTALTAGQRGRRVQVIDHANKVGKKILMSGGGRCNFTNTGTSAANYLSANPHFCKSALARYTPADFIDLVRKHRVAFHEKELGQLFCDTSSKAIVRLLLDECALSGVQVRTDTAVEDIERIADGWQLRTNAGVFTARSLVVATGGLSVPTMGATGFGYEIARRFGHAVLPTRAGLVPLTLSGKPLQQFDGLSGLALEVEAQSAKAVFRNQMLITHRGLSGPAILQISNYWQPGKPLLLDLLPGTDALAWLQQMKAERGASELRTVLGEVMPKRLAQRLCELWLGDKPLRQFDERQLQQAANHLNNFAVTASGTEGYRTAEVTLGGVDTARVSSATMESKLQPGLFFVGEVLDVTGWLGGYNFQWAWASGHAAGLAA